DRVPVAGLNRRVPPSYFFHYALLSVNFDPITYPERALQLQRHPAHHVAERVLKREANDSRQYRRGGDNPGKIGIVRKHCYRGNDIGEREHEVTQDPRRLQAQATEENFEDDHYAKAHTRKTPQDQSTPPNPVISRTV